MLTFVLMHVLILFEAFLVGFFDGVWVVNMHLAVLSLGSYFLVFLYIVCTLNLGISSCI
jgi:hypothetical protein